jgi:hypothetical protein
MSNVVRRRILAVMALVSLVAAAAIWLWRPGWELELAFCSRTGGVLLAAWLAFDDLQRLPGWILILLPALLIVIVRWPRFLLVLIPAIIAGVILRKVLANK